MAGILTKEAALRGGRGRLGSVVWAVPSHLARELASSIQLMDAFPTWPHPLWLGKVAGSLHGGCDFQHGRVVGRPLRVRHSGNILVPQALQEPVHELGRGFDFGGRRVGICSNEEGSKPGVDVDEGFPIFLLCKVELSSG